MIVIAYLCNTNGMASWCWEAAHSLAESGQGVILVCAPEVVLSETTSVNIVRFAPPRLDAKNKILREVERLSDKSSEFVYYLHQHLIHLGLEPSVYLFNQSDLLDDRISVPQHVVAWAYPTSLADYVGKIGKLSGGAVSLNTLRILFDAIGWWRKDWRSYRQAASVLAVSQRLNADLVARGVKSAVVHPGTELSVVSRAQRAKEPYKIMTVALGLEEPRKRVRWLIEALQKMPKPFQFSLTLVGDASPEFREWACRDGFPATFAGIMSRSKVQILMAQQDLFLFGSALDDWGYVLIEAMSQGLCVVAPDLSPFDEIVADTGVLYSAYSQQDLCGKLSTMFGQDMHQKRSAAQSRASALFSRRSFSHALLQALSPVKDL